MKWTKKRALFVALQLLCWIVAPLIFVVLQYSTLENTPATVGFKIGITGVLLVVLVLILFKRLFLSKYIKKLALKIATFETQIETEVDPAKITTIEHAIRKAKTIESLYSFVLPAVLLLASMYVCWALEQAIVKLFGVLGFITSSYVLGEVFALCEIACIESKHRRDDGQA